MRTIKSGRELSFHQNFVFLYWSRVHEHRLTRILVSFVFFHHSYSLCLWFLIRHHPLHRSRGHVDEYFSSSLAVPGGGVGHRVTQGDGHTAALCTHPARCRPSRIGAGTHPPTRRPRHVLTPCRFRRSPGPAARTTRPPNDKKAPPLAHPALPAPSI
jgi:hypothetical protein